MCNEGKIKFKINREMKIRVPKLLMKRVNEVLSQYGGRNTLADLSGLHYNTIGDVKKSGLATKPTIEALEKAFQKQAA